MQNRVLNLKKSAPDPRDYKYKHIMKLEKPLPVPAKVSLMSNPLMPRPYNQFQWGSCTGNAGERAKFWLDMRYNKISTGSRRAIYKFELEDQGTPNEDAGSSLRQTCLTIINHGVPSEGLWQYGPEDGWSLEKFLEEPTKEVIADAAKHKADAFYKIETRYQMQHCLASGYVWIMGINVPASFMDSTGSFARTGVFKMPKRSETIEGGHALAVTGYQMIDGVLYYEVPNSWGTDIFNKGVMMLPAQFIEDTYWTSDCYTLRLAKEPAFGMPETKAA